MVPKSVQVAEQGRDQRGQEPETVMPVGKVAQYIQGSDWGNFTEQVAFFFLGNGIRNAERTKTILMANVPAESFQIIKKTYERIVQVMRAHVKPERSALVSRYEFTIECTSPRNR